jgi:LysM repeat protein
MRLLAAFVSIVLLTWSLAASATAPTTTYRTVVVKSGDTMSRLARRHGTTVAIILSANGLTNPDRLFAGQKLKVPRAVTEDVTPSSIAPQKEAKQPSKTSRRTSSESTPSATRRRAAEKHVLLKHWVREGESIPEIARTYGVSAQSIIETNGIHKPDAIIAGMVLWIPRDRSRAPKVKATQYLLRLAGDERHENKEPSMQLTSRRVIKKRSLQKQRPGSRSLARPKRQKRLGAIVSP